MTVTHATLSIPQLVFFNTLHRKRQMPIAQRHICLYILDSTVIQDSGVAKWWMCSHNWVVCELSPCYVGLLGEEGGIFRDTKVHRYRQYGSQSIFNNICRIFSMALLYRCFKHVLPWTKGRRETYLWFQAVTAKLLFLLNIPV